MPRLIASLLSLAVLVAATAVLAIVILCGLKAAPEAGGRTAWRERGPDPWRLRPSDVAATGSIAQPEPTDRRGAALPDEPRVVRVVYPGLLPPR